MLGAICGDIIGSRHEFNPIKQVDFDLLNESNRWTDDTVCTLAVADALLNGKTFQESLVEWVQDNPDAGYGLSFFEWALKEDPEERVPYGSWGNGSAMRVSSVAWLTNGLEETVAVAAESAKVSHNHHHGIRGAKATAAAVRMALEGYRSAEISEFITDRFGYDLTKNPDQIRVGYSFEVACHRSVPQAISCLIAARSWEETVRLCVSLGGDADTQAAIAGSIAEPLYGLPAAIKKDCLARVPDRFKKIIHQFDEKVDGKSFKRSNLSTIKADRPVKKDWGVGDEKYQAEMKKIQMLEKSVNDVESFRDESKVSMWKRWFG